MPRYIPTKNTDKERELMHRWLNSQHSTKETPQNKNTGKVRKPPHTQKSIAQHYIMERWVIRSSTSISARREYTLGKDDTKTILRYYSNAIPVKDRLPYLRQFIALSDWTQPILRISDIAVIQPRKTCAFGPNSGTPFQYSGTSVKVNADIPEVINALSAIVQDVVGQWLPYVLCNLYENGHNSIGAHPDRQRGGKYYTGIGVIVSFGAKREIVFEHRSGEEVKILLEDGSILVMDPNCQQNSTHRIDKTEHDTAIRVSANFREHI